MKPASWSVGVVVPAQNEEASIASCIESIRQSCQSAQLREYWIVIAADSCTDGTVPRARSALGGAGEVLECNARSAGSARRLGVDAVLSHFGHRQLKHIWLANTDADTHVPSDWLEVQLRLADAGVAAVAGIVKLEEGGIARGSRALQGDLPDPSRWHAYACAWRQSGPARRCLPGRGRLGASRAG